jgi:hypothetical protein
VDPAGQVVLRRVAAQAALAERLEERLRRLAEMGDDPEALEAEQLVAAGSFWKEKFAEKIFGASGQCENASRFEHDRSSTPDLAEGHLRSSTD